MNTVQVECYSGYRADERPRNFTLGNRVYSVECVEDRWYSPGATYFGVRADDGNLYVLKHDEESDVWSLEAFRRHDTIPRQGRKDHTG